MGTYRIKLLTGWSLDHLCQNNPGAFADLWSSPLTGGASLWGGDQSMAPSSSGNPSVGAARDIL